MRRILLVVAYDGTDYHGWQVQDNGDTIEGELNKAIEKLTAEKISVIGASRTDSGVHGLCNRAVFDTDSTIPAEKFAAALNSYLPDDIRITDSKQVPDEWHPRKCKTTKTYEYVIECGNVANPLNSRYVWNIRGPLDIEKMRQAAEDLTGEHDFTSFCSVNGTALSNIRTIFEVSISVKGRTILGGGNNPSLIYDEKGLLREGIVTIRVAGNGFLYNMVRIIAGTLVGVGMGRFKPDAISGMLNAMDRNASGPTAPPQGLTLVSIEDF